VSYDHIHLFQSFHGCQAFPHLKPHTPLCHLLIHLNFFAVIRKRRGYGNLVYSGLLKIRVENQSSQLHPLSYDRCIQALRPSLEEIEAL
jgi:hypothetical protein